MGRYRSSIAYALAVCALAVALTGCTTTVVSAPANSSLNTVTASGSGTVSAVPDEADMSFGVSAQARGAKAALDQASAKATTMFTALKNAGVADKDLQTANVSVYPQYGNSTSSNPPIVGYQASLSVTAKVRDLSALSKVIDAGTKAGADNVNGPTFTLSEDAPYSAQAIQKAVDDARKTAAAMAKAAGKSLGEVVSVTENSAGSPIQPFGSVPTASAKSAAVPIQPGQLDVTANVTVVFALK